MLGGFYSWQDPLCWSGPSLTRPVAGGWKKAREAIKCSLLRGNVSSISIAIQEMGNCLEMFFALSNDLCTYVCMYVIQKLDYFIIANSNDRETAICCIIVSHPMPAQHFRTTVSGHYCVQLVFELFGQLFCREHSRTMNLDDNEYSLLLTMKGGLLIKLNYCWIGGKSRHAVIKLLNLPFLILKVRYSAIIMVFFIAWWL